jgi:DNA gyrase/topoisomerase IV subunit A
MVSNTNSSHAPAGAASPGSSRVADNANTSPGSPSRINEEREQPAKSSTAALESRIAKLESMILNLERLKHGGHITGDHTTGDPNPASKPSEHDMQLIAAADEQYVLECVLDCKHTLMNKIEELQQEQYRLEKELKDIQDKIERRKKEIECTKEKTKRAQDEIKRLKKETECMKERLDKEIECKEEEARRMEEVLSRMNAVGWLLQTPLAHFRPAHRYVIMSTSIYVFNAKHLIVTSRSPSTVTAATVATTAQARLVNLRMTSNVYISATTSKI